MRSVSLGALGALTLLAVPALAAPAPSWTADKPSSRVAFVATMNGQAINGSFKSWATRIAFDPKNLAGSSVVAVIDMGSAVTGDATRDEALPSADWFSVKAFPRATFVARQFKDLGGGRYQAVGELTMRGVKRPATLPFQLAINGTNAKMQGSLTLDRTHFGVGQGQWASGDPVAAGVKVNITLIAKRGG